METTFWRQDTEIRFPVSAANQRHDERSRLFVRVTHNGATGFGEVSPQPQRLNGDPGILDVLDELRLFVVPQLRQIVEREGDLPSWSRVARFAGARVASNTAVALIEMALLDRELRAANRMINAIWPQECATPLQATVSLLDDDEWHVGPDVGRVRAKTASRMPSDWAMERLSTLRVPVLLDFNCAAVDDSDVLEQVRVLGEVVELDGVEQPYDVGNVVDMARLAEQLPVAMSVDEGLRSLRDLAQVVRYRAAQIICVKPSRVGGVANARTLIATAQEAGLRPYVGGFFESPFARQVNKMVAGTSVTEPSDLAPVPVRLDGYIDEVDLVNDGFGVVPSAQMLEKMTSVLFDG